MAIEHPDDVNAGQNKNQTASTIPSTSHDHEYIGPIGDMFAVANSLVVWNMTLIFHIVANVIIPIDFHMFQRD